MDKARALFRAREYLGTLTLPASAVSVQGKKEYDGVWRLRCEMHALIARLTRAETQSEITICCRAIYKKINDGTARKQENNQG